MNDFLPPPPANEQQATQQSEMSESEMERQSERAVSNPLHYQSSTSRASVTSNAPQPVAAHIEVTPYGPQLMVSMLDSNGQVLSIPWTAPNGNAYAYLMPHLENEQASTTELEEVTSSQEEDDDDEVQTDADAVDGGANGESDATSFALEVDFDTALKRASNSLPGKRLFNNNNNNSNNNNNAVLPLVHENHASHTFSLGQCKTATAYRTSTTSPYSSDNSTYGIVLPAKLGGVLLPGAANANGRAPIRKRRSASHKQAGKESPNATDLNANA